MVWKKIMNDPNFDRAGLVAVCYYDVKKRKWEFEAGKRAEIGSRGISGFFGGTWKGFEPEHYGFAYYMDLPKPPDYWP